MESFLAGTCSRALTQIWLHMVWYLCEALAVSPSHDGHHRGIIGGSWKMILELEPRDYFKTHSFERSRWRV